MTAYYNELDPHAATWLRNLIAAGLIAPGEVDERSICDVHASDLLGFNQVHFFAGIGGWSYALRLSGVPDSYPVWTGSCPCQPFSLAGKRKGIEDERHLWPEMYRLICEHMPPVVFGEQVSSAIGHGWLDGISNDLEDEGYAVGAAVLPACSIGAPHIRQRLFWLADSDGAGRLRQGQAQSEKRFGDSFTARAGAIVGMGNTASNRSFPDAYSGIHCGEEGTRPWYGESERSNFWIDFDIVQCADGKQRRIESGSQPLVDGIPFILADGRTIEGTSRQEILKGIGNAIVPQVAAVFIKACL